MLLVNSKGGEQMGLFDFWKKKQEEKQNYIYAKMVNGETPIYSQFGENIYASDVVQQALYTIVTEVMKLNPKHIRKKGFDVIIIKNSIDESVLEKNPNLVTIKEEPNHGYGMKQIKSIVEKYDGNIDIYEKNEMFIISIMLG